MAVQIKIQGREEHQRSSGPMVLPAAASSMDMRLDVMIRLLQDLEDRVQSIQVKLGAEPTAEDRREAERKAAEENRKAMAAVAAALLEAQAADRTVAAATPESIPEPQPEPELPPEPKKSQPKAGSRKR